MDITSPDLIAALSTSNGDIYAIGHNADGSWLRHYRASGMLAMNFDHIPSTILIALIRAYFTEKGFEILPGAEMRQALTTIQNSTLHPGVLTFEYAQAFLAQHGARFLSVEDMDSGGSWVAGATIEDTSTTLMVIKGDKIYPLDYFLQHPEV